MHPHSHYPQLALNTNAFDSDLKYSSLELRDTLHLGVSKLAGKVASVSAEQLCHDRKKAATT